MINITDSHIEEIERKFGFSFDDESKEFIKCLETKDIQACPGAGKTTSLVAKLDIIAQHMPFKDNSGILVLTHTNVAVDEIKKKLGLNAKTLLSYPNHVGTFQSFVNKFLAIPFYIYILKKRPERIDTDIFYKKFEAILKSYHESVFGWLSFIASTRNVSAITVYQKLTLNDEKDKFYYNNQGNAILTREKKKIFFNNIKKIKERDIENELIIDGLLTYSHCYDFALDYLNTFPLMKEVFQKRFKYVFVDEVQDTDDRQFEIIDKLFLNSDVVIQRIGDKNQAIFSNMNSSSIGWEVNSNFLEIKNTKRLSKVISEKVTNFAISPQDLNGNEQITIPPTIILYDIENIRETVLKEFGNIIIENGLHNISNSKFKAIGAVGKIHEKGEITIPSYFPDFTRNDDDSVNYDSILKKVKLFDKNKFLAKDFRKFLLDVVIEYLKLKDVKNEDKYFTKKTLFQFLENKEKNLYIDFKIKLFNSVKKLYKQECIDSEIKIKLEIILDLFEKRVDENSLKTIIKNYKVNFSDKTNKNKFKYENADIEFEIDISTIHKIKGETHTATLVLETYKNKYDLEILLNLLKNKKRASFDDKKKLLYVAMSRPTHLLCFAMNKEHVNELDREELRNCGFIIKDI